MKTLTRETGNYRARRPIRKRKAPSRCRRDTDTPRFQPDKNLPHRVVQPGVSIVETHATRPFVERPLNARPIPPRRHAVRASVSGLINRLSSVDVRASRRRLAFQFRTKANKSYVFVPVVPPGADLRDAPTSFSSLFLSLPSPFFFLHSRPVYPLYFLPCTRPLSN